MKRRVRRSTRKKLPKTINVSYRFDEETRSRLDKISSYMKCTDTRSVEFAIKRLYKRIKLEEEKTKITEN